MSGLSVDAELKALLDRVKSGKTLSASDRLRALELLEEEGVLSAAQLAQMLGVSVRQIHRDRANLRKKYQELALSLDLLGEAFRGYTVQMAILNRRLADESLDDRLRLSYLRERRELLFGFLDRFAAFRLEDALRKISSHGDSSSITLQSAS